MGGRRMNRISGPNTRLLRFQETHGIPLSEWEWAELMKRARSAQLLPPGERGFTFRSIAADYGISVRTIHRYLRAELTPVKVGRHRALFMVRKHRPPTQVTGWEAA